MITKQTLLTTLSRFLENCKGLFYTKPVSGIPESDLSQSTQSLLRKISLLEERIGDPTFAGLNVAMLSYDGEGYVVGNNWFQNSFGTAHGEEEGSTYFSYEELGKLFEDPDWTYPGEEGDLENNIDPFHGWRLPTDEDLHYLFSRGASYPRPGSVLNNEYDSCKYAAIQLTDGTYGFLLFPDNCSISGEDITNPNADSISPGLSREDIENYISQGCIFIVLKGYYEVGGWNDVETIIPTSHYTDEGIVYSTSLCKVAGEQRLWINLDRDASCSGNYYYSILLVKKSNTIISRINALEEQLSGVEELLSQM